MFPLRDERPVKHIPIITIIVVVLVTLIYLWQSRLPEATDLRVVYTFGVVPSFLFGFRQPPTDLIHPVLTLITAQFLHGGWLHLLGNLLYLWVFAPAVEDRLGHIRFAALFLLAGIVSGLAQSAIEPRSFSAIIGASGAISGILGAYLVLFPRVRIHVLIPIYIVVFKRFRWPASIFIGIWFALQVATALFLSGSAGGVAVAAHIAGFIAGLVLVRVLTPSKPSPWEPPPE